jgi:hypothetical protein
MVCSEVKTNLKLIGELGLMLTTNKVVGVKCGANSAPRRTR